jgi:hypothetical protein
MSDQEARNIATALAYVACLDVGYRAGWAHHRRAIEGKWAMWETGKYYLQRAGLWVDQRCPFYDDDAEEYDA